MTDHGDLRRFAEDTRVFRGELGQHRLEGLPVTALRKPARHFTLRSVMDAGGCLASRCVRSGRAPLHPARRVEERCT